MGRLTRLAMLFAYQLTVVAGLAFMPVALLAKRFGLPTPSGQLFASMSDRLS
ncbi:MAG: hypothetical protein U5K28_03250 [Halobacteriales archaeon]|nr:hypothetical protein [Halobacteriales archaeon]